MSSVDDAKNDSGEEDIEKVVNTQVLLSSGSHTIQAGDHVVLFATPENLVRSFVC